MHSVAIDQGPSKFTNVEKRPIQTVGHHTAFDLLPLLHLRIFVENEKKMHFSPSRYFDLELTQNKKKM